MALDRGRRPGSLLERADWLRVDYRAGALVGAALLALSEELGVLYGLPVPVLRFVGAANLLYALGSFALARRRPMRSARPVAALAAANLLWAGACAGMALSFAGLAGPLGLAHLLAEGAFVGTLAAVEWDQRERLRGIGSGPPAPPRPSAAP